MTSVREKPDYLIRAAGHELVVEVKSFNTPPMPLSSPSGFVRAPELKAVRRKISEAAAQLKDIDGYPVVVVLTNPRRSWVPLAADQVIDAMYGDKVVMFDEHGKLQWRTGRNGRLHVDEPDDSVRGSHPHLSAVAVLRHTNAQDALGGCLAPATPGRLSERPRRGCRSI